jgi:hypothetical protein
MLFAFPAQRLLYMYSHFPSRPRPIRFTAVKTLYYSPSGLAPFSPHCEEPYYRLIWLYKQRPLFFPDDITRPTDPHHHHTMVVVRYRVLYHHFPLIASLPSILFANLRIDWGWAILRFSVMI